MRKAVQGIRNQDTSTVFQPIPSFSRWWWLTHCVLWIMTVSTRNNDCAQAFLRSSDEIRWRSLMRLFDMRSHAFRGLEETRTDSFHSLANNRDLIPWDVVNMVCWQLVMNCLFGLISVKPSQSLLLLLFYCCSLCCCYCCNCHSALLLYSTTFFYGKLACIIKDEPPPPLYRQLCWGRTKQPWFIRNKPVSCDYLR